MICSTLVKDDHEHWRPLAVTFTLRRCSRPPAAVINLHY